MNTVGCMGRNLFPFCTKLFLFAFELCQFSKFFGTTIDYLNIYDSAVSS